MKKVLVPIDFSEESVSAFRFALDLAAQAGGMVHLLNVIRLPVLHDAAFLPIAGFERPLVQDLKDVADKKFKKLIEVFSSQQVPVQASAVTGRIQSAIIDHIKKNHIDLLVMGTKGATGMRDWAVGSHTEKMVRTSPVPVIAIKNYIPGTSIRNIVFPNTLDTENQEGLMMKIKELQNFFQAQLHIIWVNTPALSKPDAEIRQRLNAFAKRFMLKDYTVNVFNYTNEELGIMEFTKQINGDMIAMSTHGLTGVAHILAGSVAEDVVNHVHHPVWTFRTESARTLTNQK